MADEEKPSSKSRDWITSKSVSRRTPAKSNRMAIFLLAFAFLSLGGIIVAWLAMPEGFQQPRVLILSISEYGEPLPPLPFARQDGEEIKKSFGRDDVKYSFDNQEKDQLLKELTGLKSGKEETVIIYLRGLVRMADGKVQFLTANAKDSTASIPFDAILSALKECPAKSKLVLLDVMSPQYDPFAGPADSALHELLFKSLKDHISKENDPNSHFLCACDRGQVSHVSEEWRQSVFAHYAARGLAGWADGALDAAADYRISAKELAAFVKQRVERWARLNEVAQNPVYIGGEGDFDLVVYDTDNRPEIELPAEAKPDDKAEAKPAFRYPFWLEDRWVKAWNADRYPANPALWCRDRQQALQRAELLWRAGRPDKEVGDYLAKAFDSSVPFASVAAAAKPHSVAQLPTPTANQSPQLKAYLALLDNAKPEQLQQRIKEFEAKSMAICEKNAYPDLACWIWQEACARSASTNATRLDYLYTPLSYPAEGKIRLVEIEQMAKLVEWLKDWESVIPNSASTSGTVLQTIRMGEVFINSSPDTLLRMFPSFEKVLDISRDARRNFLKGKDAEQSAAKLAEVAKQLEPLLDISRELDAGRDYFERASKSSLQTVRYAQLSNHQDALWEQAGRKVFEELTYWRSVLNDDTRPLPRAEELKAHRLQFADAWEKFRRPFRQEDIGSLLLKAKSVGSDEFEARLRALGWQADDFEPKPPAKGEENIFKIELSARSALWTALRQRAVERHTQVLQKDKGDETAPQRDLRPESKEGGPRPAYSAANWDAATATPWDETQYRTRQKEILNKARELRSRHYRAEGAVYIETKSLKDFFDSLAASLEVGP